MSSINFILVFTELLKEWWIG